MVTARWSDERRGRYRRVPSWREVVEIGWITPSMMLDIVVPSELILARSGDNCPIFGIKVGGGL